MTYRRFVQGRGGEFIDVTTFSGSVPSSTDTPFGSREIGDLWTWRTQRDKRLKPSDMKTTHLFFTLCMIWNHNMPEAAKIHPYRMYSFGDFYTREYLQAAVRHLGAELYTRTDLPADLQRQLARMVAYFEKHRKIEATK